jgi:AcrR family transcriptional regulator
MSGKAISDRQAPVAEPARRDRRAERRDATRAEILKAAWELVGEQGLSELSLRDLGERVGMRAQSLYSYFDSKHAIYDAMFQEGNEELLRRTKAVRDTDLAPAERSRLGAQRFTQHTMQDMTRSQLLFLRTLPGFVPSPEAYATAVLVLELARDRLADIGITQSELLDIWTALVSGLIQQQWANDPEGDRWLRLLDDTLDMFLAYAKRAPVKKRRS